LYRRVRKYTKHERIGTERTEREYRLRVYYCLVCCSRNSLSAISSRHPRHADLESKYLTRKMSLCSVFHFHSFYDFLSGLPRAETALPLWKPQKDNALFVLRKMNKFHFTSSQPFSLAFSYTLIVTFFFPNRKLRIVATGKNIERQTESK